MAVATAGARVRVGASRYRAVMMGLAVAFVAAFVVGVALGAVWISPWDSLQLIGWKLHLTARPHVPASTEAILLQLRLPRVLLAVAVGAALATAGTLFQGLFRNPMADPAIIGVSSGAALAAVGVIVAGAGSALGGMGVTLAAFVGALATAFLVYRLARIGPTTNVATLLLAGIAVAALVSAVMSVVMSLAGEQIRSIYFWLLGGLGARSWQSMEAATPLIAVGIAIAIALAGELNLMSMGEERAAQLGVEIERFKRLSLAAGALLAAAAVSVSGVIGFVGLMIPHLLRLVVGSDHRRLLPAVLLAGPTFLILADLAARTVIAPEELPVGAVTAILGAPFFLYLLRHQRRVAGPER
ncbi:MAG: FecCD family ABC transporter permease [Actinomycetota bacterium]